MRASRVSALLCLASGIAALAACHDRLTPSWGSGAPSKVSAVAHLDSVSLSWTASPGASGYVAYVATNGAAGPSSFLRSLPATATTVDVTALTPGVVYDFTVTSVRAGGESPPSPRVRASVLGNDLAFADAPSWSATDPDGTARFGHPVRSAGDVNGDGFEDVLIGAYESDAGGNDAGEAFLFLGSASGLSAIADRAFTGTQAGEHFGVSACGVGDVDGDGFLDIAIGASDTDAPEQSEGRVTLWRGSATGFAQTPSQQVELNQTMSNLARFIVPAGDVNADGKDDVLVSVVSYDNVQVDEGRAVLLYGTNGGVTATNFWANEPDVAVARYGWALPTRPGDANGDGFDDLLIGAHLWEGSTETDEGRAYMYLGSPSGPTVGAEDWARESNQIGARFGDSLDWADVNGDGRDDAVVGASLWSGGGIADRGRAYVYLGTPAGLDTAIAWVFDGGTDSAFAGGAVAGGDVNGDGFDDVAVGAWGFDAPGGAADAGKIFLFLGGPSGLSLTPAWSAEGPAADSTMGGSLAFVDANGDGHQDLIAGVQGDVGVVSLINGAWLWLGPPAVGPSADAGAPITGSAGAALSPSGAAFTDIESAHTCRWSWGDGGPETVVTPCDAGTVSPSHTWNSPGTYDVRLRVENGYGLYGESATVALVQ